MRGMILLADGFEDIEAITVIDLLRRASIIIDTVSITSNIYVISQSLIKIKADFTYNEVQTSCYDFLIIPGGKAVFNHHLSSNVTRNFVNEFYQENKLICAICAAPRILLDLGLLSNKEYTIYPGCDNDLNDEKLQGINTKKQVQVTNNIITSKAPGTSVVFAYEIIKKLLGNDTADKIINDIYYKTT